MKNPLIERYGKEKRWVNYKIETRNGKRSKLPYSPRTGHLASSTDENAWGIYDEAIAKSPQVGIIFKADKLLLGIDLDYVVQADEIVHEEKKKIKKFLQCAQTYVEVSPSGEGLHVYLELADPLILVTNKKSPYEIYTAGRYFTSTGIPFGSIRPVRKVTSSEALELLKILGYPWSRDEETQTTDGNVTARLSDDQVLERMFLAKKKGAIAKKLYEGDTLAYKDDVSRADMALCGMLAFWTGKDAAQMERLWLGSELGKREKVQNRKDYIERTIAAAIASCKNVYTPRKEGKKKETIVTPPRPRIHQFDKQEKGTSFQDWKSSIGKNFPDLVFASEVAASVISQILITDITNPSAVVLVDVPSSGKTIAINFFSDIPELAYPTDKFTPASFVSNAANVKKEELAEIDLLPRIQYKMLMIRDMATLFSKRDDDLNEMLGILTRVLDGEGLNTDSGVHGSRQYNGEYLFMLLAASTPIPHKVWKMMGILGSRLLFLRMHSRDKEEVELVGQLKSLAYKQKEKECRLVTKNFLETLWHKYREGIVWNKNGDRDEELLIIVRCAQMLSKLRGVVNVYKGDWDEAYKYEAPVVEKPDRINQLFYNLARGHALMSGRTQIDRSDLKLIVELCMDSVPTARANTFAKIIEYGGTMKTSEIEKELSCSKPSALREMETLSILGVCSMERSSEGSVGSPETKITLSEEFKWLLSEECAAIRGIPAPKNREQS